MVMQTLVVGGTYSFKSKNFPTRYIHHRDSPMFVEAGDVELFKSETMFVVRSGLSDQSLVSLESVKHPGWFLRHYNYRIRLDSYDGGNQFRRDATFRPRDGLADPSGISFE